MKNWGVKNKRSKEESEMAEIMEQKHEAQRRSKSEFFCDTDRSGHRDAVLLEVVHHNPESLQGISLKVWWFSEHVLQCVWTWQAGRSNKLGFTFLKRN